MFVPMSAFSFLATSLLANGTHKDTHAMCLVSSDERRSTKKIPNLPPCLMDMILRKIEKSWKDEHEKRFFFVMTQLTYPRLETLIEVTHDTPCECSHWYCACDDKTDVDAACYFPLVFTKWNKETLTYNRQRKDSDYNRLFTFDPTTLFEWSHNKDGGTRKYWNILTSNCGLNEKFVFPYNADMLCEQKVGNETQENMWDYFYQGVRLSS